MKRLILVVCLCLSLTACVNPDDVRTLDGRVYEQNQRIDTLEQKLEQQNSVNSQTADSWSQMQALRQELAESKGELELIRREMETLRQSREGEAAMREGLSEDVQDVKIAVQRMNSQLATDIDLAAIRAERHPAPAAVANGAPGVEPGVASDEPMDTAMTQPAEGDAPTGETVIAAPQDAQPSAPAAQPAMTVDADAAMTLYKSARAAFEATDYKQGVALWEEFVTTFPQDKLVPNALFWQGECYFQLKDYARSVLKYQAVIDNYPKSTKYPTSLLKQGISFMRLDKPKMGRLRLEEVASKYPSTVEGKRAASILKEKN